MKNAIFLLFQRYRNMPYVLKALGKSVYRSMNSRFATGYDFRRRGGEGETGFLRME